MEYSFSSSAIVVLVACSSILYLVKRYLELEHDPKEPPLMPQKIPYIGHVLGLIQHGLRYYTKLKYGLISPELRSLADSDVAVRDASCPYIRCKHSTLKPT